MLTNVRKEEDGSISAVEFIAETPKERENIALLMDGFLKMASEPKPEPHEE